MHQFYYHDTPGRLRIRIPDLRGNEPLADEVAGMVRSVAGVESCRTNLLTGSVVVRYDRAATDGPAVVAPLEAEGHFRREQAISLEQHIRDNAHKGSQALWNTLAKHAFKAALSASPLSPLAVLL
jgi:cation transport ATPase